MEPLISVIIPVYNVEQYLRRCVDSVIAQSYSNIEIILIDDGSTDKSGEICDEIGKTDDRIIVYHKENGGVSRARNYGIDRAKGEYIGFVDSDDFIAVDMYEYLYKLISENDSKIAICGAADYYSDDSIVYPPHRTEKKVHNIEAIRMMLESETPMYVVNKLFAREVFKDIRFEPDMIYEDALILLDLFKHADNVAVSSDTKYYYYRRPGSLSSAKYSEKIHDIVKAHDHNYYIASSIDASLCRPAKARQCWARLVVLDRMIVSGRSLNEPIAKKYIDFVRGNTGIVVNNKLFTAKRKAMFVSLCISPSLYAFLVGKFGR